MARTLPFRQRPSNGSGPTPPIGPDLHTFAGKIQLLVLLRPKSARVVEEFVERLLTEIGVEI